MTGTEVVATTADPAFAVDLEGKVIAWNRAAEASLGFQRSQVLSRRCWRMLRGLDCSSNRYCDSSCPIRAMAAHQEPIHRTRMYFHDASGAPVLVWISSLVLNGRKGLEVVHLFRPSSGLEEEENGRLVRVSASKQKASLSPRQLEVLRHLADGKGTREIAQLLCVSTATVRHHIQHVLHRLKVHRRLEAVVLARRLGLV